MTIRNRRGMPKNGAVKTLKDIAYKQTEVHGRGDLIPLFLLRERNGISLFLAFHLTNYPPEI